MSGLAWLKRSRRATIVALAVALSIVTGGAALAASSGLTFVPHKADQITNLGVLETQIKNYYGDPSGTGVFAPDSNYAREARSVAAAGERWLKSHVNWWVKSYHHKSHHMSSAKPAIVLDVDDTTLTTWNYEIFSNWAYNPSTNATYVEGQLFPATPGMVEMANWAAKHGYAIFYITGRPNAQEAATLGNLTSDGVGVDAGYPDPTTLPDGTDGLFTKPKTVAPPTYLTCGTSCSTIQYKSLTRKYIESQGYDIVASFGDQYSDLKGGYADKTFKMPNPNYYLP